MNKEELKALNKRLDDYFRKLVNNDEEIGWITWKDAHIKSIETFNVLIRLILEERQEYKTGTMTTDGWVYIGNDKACKIRMVVQELRKWDREANKEINFSSDLYPEIKDTIKRCEEKLDELLKDL